MALCLGCMEEKGDSYICPFCGYAEGTPPKESYHIKPGEILHGKYIVGKVLGYGGFGITYIALDYALGRKVAIKEFLPSDFATRMPGETVVTVYNGEATRQFEAGLERFVEEAQRLAKFNSMGSIVDIYDTFIENSTGYIVMQYLAGDTVKDLLEKNGVMPYESARLIIVEVLKTLEAVHKEGIIHRDISPDNIFITNDNQIKLLDFGAARYASGFHSKSLSVILKPGYAPEEQYRSHGNQGPWSDVYATAATLYKMITGITIEEAMERTVSDKVKSPLELGVDLPEGANTAIMNALNIHAELRTQSAGDFIRELASDEVERIIDKPVKTDSGKMPLWLKIAIPSVIAIAITLITLVVTGVIKIPGFGGIGLGANPESRVPGVINQMMKEGERILEKEGLGMQIIAQDYDEFAEKDIIKTQSPAGGKVVKDCYFDEAVNRYMVYVLVSGGPSPKMVPDVAGMPLEEATSILQELGFLVESQEEYSQDVAAGVVISQDIVNQEYEYGSTLHLVVSKGEMKIEEAKTHKIPNLVGLSYEQAYKKLTAIGMYVEKKDEPSTKKENQVLSQSVAKDTECPEGTVIVLTVSNNSIVIPNVQYKEKNEAKRLIEAAGAKVVIKEVENSTVAAGLVISQSKSGKATAGTTVTLQVSKGEASQAVQDAIIDIQNQTVETQKGNTTVKVTVPYVSGKTEADAKSTVQNAGLGVNVSYQRMTDPAKEGKVISTSPASGVSVDQGTAVTLYVGTYEKPKTETVTVPNVVGKTESGAKSTLKNAGLKVSVSMQAVTDSSKDGKVISTSPASGVSLEKDSTVTLYVGAYEKPKAETVAVPDVVGKTESSAKSTIQNAGLKASVKYQEVNDTSKDGKVISTSPAGGGTLEKGAAVTLYVGTYKAPKKTVPKVSGEDKTTATRRLKDEGFQVKVTYQDVTEDYQDDMVLSTSPLGGSYAEAGSTVIITVGRATTVKVPDVTGGSYTSAERELKEAGFTVEKATVNVTDENEAGRVVKTSPSGGTSAVYGSKVIVSVGYYKEVPKVTVPNVEGMPLSEATQILLDAGFKVRAKSLLEEHINSPVVQFTIPDWGEEAPQGSEITVYTGE